MKNYHIIKVTYLGATNIRGSRVKMYSERFLKSKLIPYDHSFSNTCDIALNWQDLILWVLLRVKTVIIY